MGFYKLLCLFLVATVFSYADERPLVVWKEYYPQLKLVVDQYNAAETDKIEISPSVSSWPRENMRAGDGSAARAFVSSEFRIPDQALSKFSRTPIWLDGFALFINKRNPFISQLGKIDIPAETLKKIWTKGVTWEELCQSDPKEKKTPVVAYSANRKGLEKFTGTKDLKFVDSDWNSGVTVQKVNRDIYAIGTFELRNQYGILIKMKNTKDGIVALGVKKLPNGKYRLVPTPSGEEGRTFEKVVRNGEIIPFNFSILTKDADDDIGKKLAAAAERLGSEKIFGFGYVPLKISEAKKVPEKKFVFAHAMSCFLFGGVVDFGRKSNVSPEDFQNWPSADNKFRAWWSCDYAKYAGERSVEASKVDLDLAQAAGLDAIGILLSPYMISMKDSPYGKAIKNMVIAAENHKVKIIPDVWDFFTPAADKDEQHIVLDYFAQELLDLMKKYPNAFYKHNGKYVVCFGNPVARATYAELEPMFNLFGGRKNVELIAGIRDEPKVNQARGWVDGPDMLTAFSVHLSWGDEMLKNIFLPLKQEGKKICWAVSSSMYTNTGEANRRQKSESLGASRMIKLWRQAIENDASAAYIASWNDFSEDHHITHSNYRGDTFMLLTKYFADWFRTGKEPKIDRERLFIFHHRQLNDAKITEGKWRGFEPCWQSTPFTDYVHVVSMLKKRGNLKLKLGAQILDLKNVPAGLHEWLVYVPKTKDYKNIFPKWNAGSYENPYPQPSKNISITKIDKLRQCRPVATLVRNGKTEGFVEARTEILDSAKFSDECVVGNSAEVGRQ